MDKSVFTYKLKKNQEESWIAFCNAEKNVSRTQYPKWIEITNPMRKIGYFMFYQESELVAVSTIIENKVIANVNFGPICKTPEIYAEAIKQIYDHYKSKSSFAILRVTQPHLVSSQSEYNEYLTYKKVHFTQKIDSKNWCSVGIDLEKSIEDIQKGFSKNHKRSIKKADKLGLSVREIETQEAVKTFAGIYDIMSKERGLDRTLDNTTTAFLAILDFFKTHQKGKILAVYNEEDVILGGVILFFEGDRVFYDIGASNPEFRNYPIMHKLFFEIITLAKEKGFSVCDFGGYNLMVSQKDQITNINRFKDGFGGDILLYPKKMYFKLNKFVYFFFNLAFQLKESTLFAPKSKPFKKK